VTALDWILIAQVVAKLLARTALTSGDWQALLGLVQRELTIERLEAALAWLKKHEAQLEPLLQKVLAKLGEGREGRWDLGMGNPQEPPTLEEIRDHVTVVLTGLGEGLPGTSLGPSGTGSG
jgi:hypothetical protein